MRVVALDVSLTCTGVAIADTETPDDEHHREYRIRPRHKKGPERLIEIRDRIWRELRGPDPHHLAARYLDGDTIVVIEGYAFARGFRAHHMGELGGVLRVMFHVVGVPWIVIAPAKLKMFATGKGNASKDAVLTSATRRLGYEGHDHNIADAMWLRAMGEHHYRMPGAIDLPKAHTRALKGVSWPAM